jgi:Ca-activated chloride channel family protein
MELDEKKYLYLLIILPILVVVFLYNLYWKRKKQREFGSVELIKQLTPEKSVFKSVLKCVILILAFACLIIALVNPKIGTKTETVKREGIDIVFAVDVSKSMLTEDIAPNRLDKTKQIISQVINELGNDKIGVVAYAGSAFPVLPLTTDYGVAKMFVQSMNPGMVSSQGTSLEDAIKMSESYFDKESKTSKLVILISDGEDHSEGAKNTAEEARKAGLKILTIGVGTAKGGPIPLKRNGIVESFQRDRQNEVVISKLNEASLQEIAKITEGKYINGRSTKEVVDFVKNALENIEKTEFESTQFTDFNSQFQWFLGFGMLLLFVDIFLLEKKTSWLRKMNLFNEEKTKN